jgi:hypothetical protein
MLKNFSGLARASVCIISLSLLAACGGGKQLDSLVPAEQDALLELQALAQPPDVDAALWDELKKELARVLLKTGRSRAASAVITQEKNKVTDFAVGFSYLSNADAGWAYRNAGDYDQNGEVNIADITPVGVHFRKTSSADDWDVARMADGDGNGEINIADITPIGANFRNSLEGYLLQRTPTPEDDESWIDVEEYRISDQNPSFGPIVFCETVYGGIFGNTYARTSLSSWRTARAACRRSTARATSTCRPKPTTLARWRPTAACAGRRWPTAT